ncbi:leo1-like protein domain-containing protein [Ditylenchus destructor]|uniref:Leo1-like protein domain-containing protein n=1 Tax=Ditylenchus destructor TaxID=166010 RepID=A0AAD4R9K5_9BILA|nr:leo1-like protein domain-containing protein [Ditylenchus destructor]
MSSSDESSDATPTHIVQETHSPKSSSGSGSSSDESSRHSDDAQPQPQETSSQGEQSPAPEQQNNRSRSSSSSVASDNSDVKNKSQMNMEEPDGNVSEKESEQSDTEMKSVGGDEEPVVTRNRTMSSGSEDNDDDDEEENNKRKSGTTAAIFGDDVSSSSASDAENVKDKDEDQEDTGTNLDEIVGPRLYSDPEEEAMEEEDAAPTLIDLEMARCRADLGTEGSLFVKFPNFLSVDTKPFDPETYEDEMEDDEVLDEEGRTRLKLKIENTVRWRLRKDEHGNDVKESNAKFVKWSDGSMSLFLGNEMFDVERQKIMDHNHLFIRQGGGLLAQSVFTEKLVFRPHSTETLTHRKVTLSMADKSSKTQKVKVINDVGDNPEAQKQALIRKEEERLRASARRESQARRARDRPRVSGLTSGFLEGGYESDDMESPAAIKRHYQRGEPKTETANEEKNCHRRRRGLIIIHEQVGFNLFYQQSQILI